MSASLCMSSCGAAPRVGAVQPVHPPPPRPAQCREVPLDAPLASWLKAAPSGSAFCLVAGRYLGPLLVPAGVTLWGPRDAIVRFVAAGTAASEYAIRLAGPGATVLGLTVDGMGGRFDRMDSGVSLVADDTRVEGVRILNANFGILSERARRVVISANVIHGLDADTLGMRGDGIRLWETYGSLVEGNSVSGSRDVVVWYSSQNRLVRNYVTRSRYGTHIMFSEGNSVEDSVYVDNHVGLFIMYSWNVTVRGNVFAHGRGPGGMGIGLKESGNITATDNQLLYNTLGAYSDSSPLQAAHTVVFERNTFRLCDTALAFHSSPARTTLVDNAFLDNHVQVRVEGGGVATEITWERNRFDDYVGYDLDGDGFGDVPYKLRSLSSELEDSFPNLSFFRGSSTMALVDAASRVLPLLEPKVLVIDPKPRMRSSLPPRPAPERPDAH